MRFHREQAADGRARGEGRAAFRGRPRAARLRWGAPTGSPSWSSTPRAAGCSAWASSGPGAGELIAEGALAVEAALLAEDLALTIHTHPTLSETLMDAAESLLR